MDGRVVGRLELGMSALPLRNWQQEALSDYLGAAKRIYTCHATPASGKTQYGLAVAISLLKANEIKQLVVLCHTKQIRQQWIAAAAGLGLSLSTNPLKTADGYVFSYQQLIAPAFVSKANSVIRGRRRSLAILDEPHHLADSKKWGVGTRALLKYVHRLLLLSGTLFRYDEGTIPFVTYDQSGTLAPDFNYAYTDALRERIVGPIYFPTFGGETQWQFDEKEDAATFGEAASDRRLSRQLNTAIASKTWLSAVITAADRHLEQIRERDPAAGGLIVAKSQAHARIVAEIVEQVSGVSPEIALSDITQSNRVIAEFADGEQKWIVAVRMISEGVDIPRLRVGIYATNILTELFFRQVVGRLTRRHQPFTGQDAYLYIPQHPVLIAYAKSIAEERYHTLPEALKPSAQGNVKEVFGTFSPGTAIPEQGEILNPLQIAGADDLRRLLQEGFAALDVATENIHQARSCFEQVSARLLVDEGNSYSPMSAAPPSRYVPTPSEAQLLSVIARHREATVSQHQLAVLSGLDKMRFYDCLAALKLADYVTIDAADHASVTSLGLSVLGDAVPDILRGSGDVIRLWSTVLTKRESSLLQGLLQGYPNWLARKPLLALTEYKASAAGSIGLDLKRLVSCDLAETKTSGVYRLNPKLLGIPFSGYNDLPKE